MTCRNPKSKVRNSRFLMAGTKVRCIEFAVFWRAHLFRVSGFGFRI
jgi:hypothetical protein